MSTFLSVLLSVRAAHALCTKCTYTLAHDNGSAVRCTQEVIKSQTECVSDKLKT